MENQKVTEQCLVLKKGLSPNDDAYTVWLESADPALSSVTVNHYEYEQIQAGQQVILEYARHCKFLFKIGGRTRM